MRLVVADSGPLHYLILIEAISLIPDLFEPNLFEKVFVPQAVRDELGHVSAPSIERAWVAVPPDWLEIVPVDRVTMDDPALGLLDDGERAAIALAVAIGADLVLMDDWDGRVVAGRKGLAVTGTLGLLDLAARRGMLNLGQAFSRLKATNFR